MNRKHEIDANVTTKQKYHIPEFIVNFHSTRYRFLQPNRTPSASEKTQPNSLELTNGI